MVKRSNKLAIGLTRHIQIARLELHRHRIYLTHVAYIDQIKTINMIKMIESELIKLIKLN